MVERLAVLRGPVNRVDDMLNRALHVIALRRSDVGPARMYCRFFEGIHTYGQFSRVDYLEHCCVADPALPCRPRGQFTGGKKAPGTLYEWLGLEYGVNS